MLYLKFRNNNSFPFLYPFFKVLLQGRDLNPQSSGYEPEMLANYTTLLYKLPDGFEPPYAAYKAAVLPLDDGSVSHFNVPCILNASCWFPFG